MMGDIAFSSHGGGPMANGQSAKKPSYLGGGSSKRRPRASFSNRNGTWSGDNYKNGNATPDANNHNVYNNFQRGYDWQGSESKRSRHSFTAAQNGSSSYTNSYPRGSRSGSSRYVIEKENPYSSGAQQRRSRPYQGAPQFDARKSSRPSHFKHSRSDRPRKRFGVGLSEAEPRSICAFFVKGDCEKGSSCRFRHEIPEDETALPICPFFVKGICDRGEACRFRHAMPEMPEQQEHLFCPEVPKASSTRRVDSRSTQFCPFFPKGTCERGAQCRYRHDFPEGSFNLQQQQRPLCSFFVNGTCDRGGGCPFRHEMPKGLEAAKRKPRSELRERRRRYRSTPQPYAKQNLPVFGDWWPQKLSAKKRRSHENKLFRNGMSYFPSSSLSADAQCFFPQNTIMDGTDVPNAQSSNISNANNNNFNNKHWLFQGSPTWQMCVNALNACPLTGDYISAGQIDLISAFSNPMTCDRSSGDNTSTARPEFINRLVRHLNGELSVWIQRVNAGIIQIDGGNIACDVSKLISNPGCSFGDDIGSTEPGFYDWGAGVSQFSDDFPEDDDSEWDLDEFQMDRSPTGRGRRNSDLGFEISHREPLAQCSLSEADADERYWGLVECGVKPCGRSRWRKLKMSLEMYQSDEDEYASDEQDEYLNDQSDSDSDSASDEEHGEFETDTSSCDDQTSFENDTSSKDDHASSENDFGANDDHTSCAETNREDESEVDGSGQGGSSDSDSASPRSQQSAPTAVRDLANVYECHSDSDDSQSEQEHSHSYSERNEYDEWEALAAPRDGSVDANEFSNQYIRDDFSDSDSDEWQPAYEFQVASDDDDDDDRHDGACCDKQMLASIPELMSTEASEAYSTPQNTHSPAPCSVSTPIERRRAMVSEISSAPMVRPDLADDVCEYLMSGCVAMKPTQASAPVYLTYIVNCLYLNGETHLRDWQLQMRLSLYYLQIYGLYGCFDMWMQYTAPTMMRPVTTKHKNIDRPCSSDAGSSSGTDVVQIATRISDDSP